MPLFSLCFPLRLRALVPALGLAIAGAALLAVPLASPAQALPSGVSLGQDEASLRAQLPELEKVRRPRKAPGGALGAWHLPQVQWSGLRFEETFYLEAQGLSQVELTLVPRSPADAGADSFAGLVGQLRAQYGPELPARSQSASFVQESASWTVGEQDVIATRSGTPEQPTVRIVWRLRAVRDAGEL